MKPFRMRKSLGLDPRILIEPNCVDNQTVAFPSTSRVASVCGFEILRMLRIHIDHAKAVRSADIKNKRSLSVLHLNDLETISRAYLSRPRRRFAARVRCITFVIRLAKMVELT